MIRFIVCSTEYIALHDPTGLIKTLIHEEKGTKGESMSSFIHPHVI